MWICRAAASLLSGADGGGRHQGVVLDDVLARISRVLRQGADPC